jgi:glutathione synthase/RimK-type ligase-like ATP-grasp enzyme
MSLTVAVQMDHVSTINPRGDSTFALMLEAQARGHHVLHYTPDTLALRGKTLSALCQPITRDRQRAEGSSILNSGIPCARICRAPTWC